MSIHSLIPSLKIRNKLRVVILAATSCLMLFAFAAANATTARAGEALTWAAKLDRPARFYQLTELGVLIVGTEKSLYAIDGASGEILWRRKDTRLDETEVAAVPGTDILLICFQKGERTRVEATDILTGDTIWQTDKVRGSVMQMAIDKDAGLLAATFVRDAKARAREGFKRKPVIHVFDLATGDERWKHELSTDIEMMPARWSEKESDETDYTLDNYHPPFFLDHQLYVFYEGFTSFDAGTGKQQLRERFRVNEEGLALTEADPVVGDQFIYASGRGHVRALSRESGEIVWEAKDLGETPELILAGDVLYARTGGQFTRLRDGETTERGPYGVSAIDARTGKTLWRYKGADKGITNIALPDPATVLVADRDDLISLDARNGKRRAKVSHKIDDAAFLLLNERDEAVVGGRNELAAFDTTRANETSRTGSIGNVWRARHNPPGRGVLRITAAIALRAASVYFRYGNAATSAYRGVRLAQAAAVGLRWSGLEAARAALPNLQTLATGAAQRQLTAQFTSFGALARVRQATGAVTSLSSAASSVSDAASASAIRSRVASDIARRAASAARPSTANVEDRLLDRLDPAQQLDRLSAYLLRRRRLAALRGSYMYFYTDLTGRGGGRGLAGVNVNTGRTERAIRVGDPDPSFIADEATNLLYTADGNQLRAYMSVDSYEREQN